MSRRPKKPVKADKEIVAPQEGPQMEFLASEADITIYGGCVSCNTEYLTRDGWKRIDQYNGEEIAQWKQYNQWEQWKYGAQGKLEYIKPKRYIDDPCDSLIRFSTKRLFMELSEDHRMPLYNWNNKFIVKKAHEIEKKPSRYSVPVNFEVDNEGIDLSDTQIRLMVAIFADGSFEKNNSTNYCRLDLKKVRKQNRLEQLLKELGYEYKTYTNHKRPEYIKYSFYSPIRGKHYILFKNANKEQLEVILDEMSYWDGSISGKEGGDVSFSTTCKEDADFMQYCAHSCGRVATITIYKGSKDNHSDLYRVNITRETSVKNKVSLRGDSLKIERFKPTDGRMYCFEVESTFWIARNNNKIFITGNSAGGGKSYGLLMAPLRHIQTPYFNCTIFRKTSPQIRNAGGLWDTSMSIYKKLKGVPTESRLTWKWPLSPSGAEIRFGHMEYEQDKYNFDGSQICMLCFDELQHFSSEQFFYMLSRNRSTCGVKPRVLCTCNPDAESWLRGFIDWWIGDDGLPILERSGVNKYFIRLDGKIVWGDSKNELLRHNTSFCEKYEEIRALYHRHKKKKSKASKAQIEDLKKKYTHEIYKLKNLAVEGIKSVTFIASSVHDNKILLDTNPSYLSNLEALPLVERERLLNGNWNIKPESGKFFNRAWFEIVENIPEPSINDENEEKPEQVKECRYWDFAATKPSSKNKDPDWTVGVKIRKIGLKYFIIDVVRVRENPAELEKIFMETIQQDKILADEQKIHYSVRWEEEGGSSGKKESYRIMSNLAGYDARAVPTGGKNKETRARPLAIQAEIGNVKLLRAPWNDTLLSELHRFADPSTKHDDQVDGCSGAFNTLTSVFIHPTVPEKEVKFIPEPGSKEEKEMEDKATSIRLQAYRQIEQDFLNGDGDGE